MTSVAQQTGAQRMRRRTFLIDRRFQLKWTLIIVAVGVLVSAGLGYFIIQLSLENTELLGTEAAFAGDEVAEFDHSTMVYLIGFVAVMALCLFVWGIFMTHRVAGPIFIISRFLGQLAEGQVPQTRPLRRGDELKALFDTFASMVASLKERNAEEGELLVKAVAALKAQGANEEMVKSLEDLIEKKMAWTSAQHSSP